MVEKIATTTKVFISYNRADIDIVRPLYLLLRHVLSWTQDTVFVDLQDIVPGLQWAATIDSAIRDCDIVYVLWSRQAEHSVEMRREYTLGLRINKEVVPIIMDDTPLVDELAGIHGIDLRPLFSRPQFTHGFKDDFAHRMLFEIYRGIFGHHPNVFHWRDLEYDFREDWGKLNNALRIFTGDNS